MLYLKQLWVGVAIGAVSAGSIVAYFNVFKNCLSHDRPGCGVFTMNGLDLEGVEKALGAGIIVTVTLGAHAALHSPC